MILAIVIGDVMASIVKHLSAGSSIQELTAFETSSGSCLRWRSCSTSRNWIAAGRPLIVRQGRLAVVRGCIGVLAQMRFCRSLIDMNLAKASILVFAGPLFITLMSATILRQQLGFLRWLAVIVGFAGVIPMLQPDRAGLKWCALFSIGAALGDATTAVTSQLSGANENGRER